MKAINVPYLHQAEGRRKVSTHGKGTPLLLLLKISRCFNILGKLVMVGASGLFIHCFNF